ncbi:MAG: hypothetical protein CTY15_02900 [Methylocystis sp.]|nr:MAG: hypothetical protein CTY15_02900 [Methylocystis sp.]
MIRLAAAALAFVGLIGGAAAEPGGCAKVANKFLCADPTLLALEKEAARLGVLTVAGAYRTTPPSGQEVAQTNARFNEALVGCHDSNPCLQRTFVAYIRRLRQDSPAARSKDSEGISLGPFVAACPGLDALIGVTFVNSEPGFAWLDWRDNSFLLQQSAAASGARYTGAFGTGEAQFWSKGKDATLELPGKPTLHCQIQEGG